MSVLGWTYLFVGLSFALYLAIAWVCRVRDTKGFYIAGGGIPAAANGMATGADWMSAASFLSMAGLISFMGFSGGQFLMGWTGGYVLLALLLAPYLRKFGRFTVPDFIGDRYALRESHTINHDSLTHRIIYNPARFVAVICAIFISFTYVAGQMRGVGVVFSRFLEVDVNTGVIIGMCIVFVYATLGGMKGITWTQVAQYWVLITAFLVPAIAISIKLTGNPLPQVGMGSTVVGDSGTYLLDKLNAIHKDLGFASYTQAFGFDGEDRSKLLNMLFVTIALMVGTAGLPHVIVRFYTVKNVKAARWSAFWALLFIALLYLTAPATAVFARYYMIQSINGTAAVDKPAWFTNWEKTGLVLWLDNGDGVMRYEKGENNEIFNKGPLPVDAKMPNGTDGLTWDNLLTEHGKWLADPTKGADARKTLREHPKVGATGFGKLAGPDRDIIVLATPEMAELANWIIALVAAGGLAAALSTASGLLLVISSSVAHDLYFRIGNPQASEASRLMVGRTVIGIAVVVAGLFGIYPPGFVSEVVAFAFGLAAASFFPAIVLGIFSKRVGTVPALAGMVVGLVFTAYYIIGNVYLGMPRWCFDIAPTGIGTVGMLLNFVVTLGLTPFCKPPSPEVVAMVDSVREPEKQGPAVMIETADVH